MISLARVDRAEGRAALADAAVALAAATGATANDAKLLEVLTCIADYEEGDAAPLTAFALKLDDDSLFGEIWPSMAEPIITYGALALSVHATLASARFFLDRWKAGERDSVRFRHIVEARPRRKPPGATSRSRPRSAGGTKGCRSIFPPAARRWIVPPT